VPSNIREQMSSCIREALVHGTTSSCTELEIAQHLNDRLKTWVPHLDTADIVACLSLPHPSTLKGRTDDSQQQQVEMAIGSLVARNYRQTVQANAVFDLLDMDGKGCVVAEDLHRAVAELWTRESDEGISEEQVEEMMQFAGTDKTDMHDDMRMLSRDDIVRIARMVNL
jgi:hypothetical protein